MEELLEYFTTFLFDGTTVSENFVVYTRKQYCGHICNYTTGILLDIKTKVCVCVCVCCVCVVCVCVCVCVCVYVCVCAHK